MFFFFCHSCLRSWFQRQQTCPTCRMDVLRASQPNTTPAPAAPAPPAAPAAPANAPAPPAANGKFGHLIYTVIIIINQCLMHFLLTFVCNLFSCSRCDAPIPPRPFPFLGSLPWCSSSCCCSSCCSGSLHHATDQCRCNPNIRGR